MHPAVRPQCHGPYRNPTQDFSLDIEGLTFNFTKGKEGWDVDFDHIIDDIKMKRFLNDLYETNPKYFSEDYETTFAEWWEENPKGGMFYLNDGYPWNATFVQDGLERSNIIFRQELDGTFISKLIDGQTIVTWKAL